MNKAKALCAVLLLAFLSVNANAAHITVLTASLTADQAGLTTDDTLGKGAATMTFNSDTNEFRWFIAWQGLSSPLNNAHFHGPAGVGENAGVRLGFDFATNPAEGAAILSAMDASDLLAGLWYINLHTENFGSGEIRGQIFQISPPAVVPVPAAIWLMLTAVGGLGVMRRKK